MYGQMHVQADLPHPTPDGPGLVCVVDDDAMIRGSLVSLLRVAGMAAVTFDGPEAFRRHGIPEVPSCLILDVHLQDGSGLEFHAELKREGILMPVIFITGRGDIPMAVAGMRGGAVDFLPKPFDEEDLLDAVVRAIAQDRSRRQQEEKSSRLRDLYEGLSRRERDVMALVSAGLLNKQIAARLSVAEITVKVHRQSVMRKMEVASLADLVRVAELLGVSDPTARRREGSPQRESSGRPRASGTTE